LTHASTARKYATLASMLLVPGTDYPYGVAEVDNISGIITNFTEKPFLKILTSAGVYLFEPDVYEIIDSKIRLENESPVDLESTIMPELVKIGKLSSMIISSDKWMPINTMKEYEKVLKVLS
jgi:NDP-sugar pyrophosphorylase family protein